MYYYLEQSTFDIIIDHSSFIEFSKQCLAQLWKKYRKRVKHPTFHTIESGSRKFLLNESNFNEVINCLVFSILLAHMCPWGSIYNQNKLDKKDILLLDI